MWLLLQGEREAALRTVKDAASARDAVTFERDEAVTERDLLSMEARVLQDKHETSQNQLNVLRREHEHVMHERDQVRDFTEPAQRAATRA